MNGKRWLNITRANTTKNTLKTIGTRVAPVHQAYLIKGKQCPYPQGKPRNTGEIKVECKCGFIFAGPGEFRNCNAYMDKDGQWWVVCPDCGAEYKTGA